MKIIGSFRKHWLPISLACSFLLAVSSASALAYVHSQNHKRQLKIAAALSQKHDSSPDSISTQTSTNPSTPSSAPTTNQSTTPVASAPTPAKSAPAIDPCVYIDSLNDPIYVQGVANVKQATSDEVNQILATYGYYTADSISRMNSVYSNANITLNSDWQNYLQAIKTCPPLLTGPSLYSLIPQP